MSGIKLILIIAVVVTVILFFLRLKVPVVYHSIIKYSSRCFKGIFIAVVLFFRYVKNGSIVTKKENAHKGVNNWLGHDWIKNGEINNLEKKIVNINAQLIEKKKECNSIKNELAEAKTSLKVSLDELNKNQNILEQYKSQNKKLFSENKSLSEQNNVLKGRFYPVSKEEVADVFCNEFEQVTSCISNIERQLCRWIEETNDASGGHLATYFQAKCQDDIKVFNGWYLTLKYASSITGHAAFDVEGCVNSKEKLSYLREKAFVRYYRPMLSDLFLCIEHYRADSLDRLQWDKLISGSIAELSKLKITVNYIPTGAKYDSELYENITISVPATSDTPAGIVEKVLSIGINSPDLNVTTQETEILMNI